MIFFSFLLHAEKTQKTVILTFDDSVKSKAEFVAPLLKKHGFNATFFITEGFSLRQVIQASACVGCKF
ncbi:polysaccharide deacetylase family protein [Lentisphaera profundi]|uniref:Polysaccharide deacetylase family protein n=1 Tax=Lentisphaera profundi TaxID=1658616 RepID=A0ABY7VT12_9BACT|nr:polysaccharide deacetylase family protein [Lentisphaera profundi]WDE97338.1 polysaccharide deacetylase family protein [Lentisphaera profundi]